MNKEVEDIIERVSEKLQYVSYYEILHYLIKDGKLEDLTLLLNDKFHNFKVIITFSCFLDSILNYEIFKLLYGIEKENNHYVNFAISDNRLIKLCSEMKYDEIFKLLLNDDDVQKKAIKMKDMELLSLMRKEKINKFLKD